jgi:hypothetical protein
MSTKVEHMGSAGIFSTDNRAADQAQIECERHSPEEEVEAEAMEEEKHHLGNGYSNERPADEK